MDELGGLVCLFSIVLHTSLLIVSRFFLTAKFQHLANSQDSWTAANWLVSIFQAIYATITGVCVLYQANADLLDTRISFLQLYASFSLGYWIYDLVCLYLVVSSGPDLIARLTDFVKWWPGIVFHHLGIILFLNLGIIYTSRTRGDGIIGCALLMELSSIFVALRSLLVKLQMKATRAYVVTSVSMVATFFLSRIFLLPYVLHVYCRQSSQSFIQGITSLPRSCQLGTCSFYLLNLYWFSLMVKGCVKALRNRSLKDD